MADFSASQIEDAKKRVEQMRSRAKNATQNRNNNYQSSQRSNTHNHNTNNKSENSVLSQNKISHNNSNNNSHQGSSLPFGIDNIFKSLGIGSDDEDSKSSGLILALILVLSYEKADNMLILALLYILL